VAKSTKDHVERFLLPISQGRHLTTLALSEPGTGSHFYLPETRMHLTPGEAEYSISGSKAFVTNGGHADSYILSTVADDASAPPGHFSLLVVPGDAPGLEWGAPWDGWGMRGNSSRTVQFRDLRVPAANRLGHEGDQIWYAFSIVAPYFLVAMSGTYLGVAGRALSEVREHLAQRRHSHTGATLSEVSVLQHKLGRTWAILRKPPGAQRRRRRRRGRGRR
jgi:alkylation response protein AidB-like acyl-CoA dehydrogenase